MNCCHVLARQYIHYMAKSDITGGGINAHGVKVFLLAYDPIFHMMLND